MRLGEAVQSQSLFICAFILLVCYLIANPEYNPASVRPFVSAIRSSIGVGATAILQGWWPFVTAKIFLLGAFLFIVRRLFLSISERREERRHDIIERELADRMKRAREEAQRKLEELAAAQLQREEASAQAISDVMEVPSLDEDLERKEQKVKAARVASQEKLHQALRAAGKSGKATVVAAESLVRGKAVPDVQASVKRNADRMQQQRWVQKIQAQADEAAARETAAASAEIPVVVPAPAASPVLADTAEAPLPVVQSAPAAAPAVATAMVAPPSSSIRQSASSTSLIRSQAGGGSSGNMIPLAVAQEAAERQSRWLQQLQEQLDAPDLARQAAVEHDRALRVEQDAEYQQALEADLRRERAAQAEKEAAEEKAEQDKKAKAEAEALAESLQQQRERSRAVLPAEPEEGLAGPVLVRVRLPCGSFHQRRFAPEATVEDICRWVGTLDEMPLSRERNWKVVTSFPRAVPESRSLVQEIAGGASAVALFVEMD